MSAVPEKLLALARPVSFREGERLVRQGEAARGAFIIRRGEVEARVALPGGGTLTVATLREGEMFGEMALIERGICTASVVALGAVEASFVGREDFRAMVASREASALGLQREITRILAARLRALNARVREHPSAEDRPAAALENNSSSERKAPGFDWRAFLPILPFFDGFDAAEIDELVAGAQAYEAGRGHMLFRPGEAADACWLVVRGAVEVFVSDARLQRRIAIAGPGELVGYLAALERARHAASAQVREPACLLAIPAGRFLQVYESNTGAAIRLQHAVHKSLLRSIARTNTQLGRLISHARLAASASEAAQLEAALHGQLWREEAATRTPT